MNNKILQTLVTAVLIILLVIYIYERYKPGNYLSRIREIEKANEMLKNKVDSINKMVNERDLLLLAQIDSAYHYIGILNERKNQNAVEIKNLGTELEKEKGIRQKLLESLSQ